MTNRHEHTAMGYDDFVQTRAKNPVAILYSLTADKVDLIHAAIGIAGEVMEFYLADTSINLIEELHDIGFYIQMIENRFGSNGPLILKPGAPTRSRTGLLQTANNFLDLAKKVVVYNNDSKLDELKVAFDQFKFEWALALRDHGLTIEEANLLNQNKLIKRYANGYSDKAAAERADKAAGE